MFDKRDILVFVILMLFASCAYVSVTTGEHSPVSIEIHEKNEQEAILEGALPL